MSSVLLVLPSVGSPLVGRKMIRRFRAGFRPVEREFGVHWRSSPT